MIAFVSIVSTARWDIFSFPALPRIPVTLGTLAPETEMRKRWSSQATDHLTRPSCNHERNANFPGLFQLAALRLDA